PVHCNRICPRQPPEYSANTGLSNNSLCVYGVPRACLTGQASTFSRFKSSMFRVRVSANRLGKYRVQCTTRPHQIIHHRAEPAYTLLERIVAQQPEAHPQGARIDVGRVIRLTCDESDAAATGTIIEVGNFGAFRQGHPQAEATLGPSYQGAGGHAGRQADDEPALFAGIDLLHSLENLRIVFAGEEAGHRFLHDAVCMHVALRLETEQRGPRAHRSHYITEP